MKISILSLISSILLIQGPSLAQDNKQKDREAILSMCGCHKVSFDFAETFATDTNYKFHQPYHSKADVEWVFPVVNKDNTIVLQHLLLVQDTVVIKHWRQDWLFENTSLYTYYKDRQWKFEKKSADEVRGQWTQKVFQVDDSPRYEGSGSWVHLDGRSYWESFADAPLPRREFTKRSDYNVMVRRNRHELTDYGWLHEQDNWKVLRENGKDSTLVAEKGWNTYTKIDESHCAFLKNWWIQNEAYWSMVRIEWDNLFALNKDFELRKKVNDKMLWQQLFELGENYGKASKKEQNKYPQIIKETIAAFYNNEISALD